MVGMTPVAVDDGREPLDDLVALHTACDVDEFHRRLMLYHARTHQQVGRVRAVAPVPALP